nr:hypothetical protein CFP56_16372 [Quercus suber]
MGESALNYHQIWARVEVHLLEFKSAKVRERRAVAESTSAVRWRPPSPNHYKINFDEAIFFNVGATGLGVVIRDSCGRVIGFLAKRVPLPTSTTTVEALACRRVLLFAKELACVDTAFERDAELIIKALLGREVRHLETSRTTHCNQELASFKSFFISPRNWITVALVDPPCNETT